jgi:hypothetical protein
MKLREDSEPYCLAWLGIILLSSYYFNFLYQFINGVTTIADSLWLMIWPIASVWFFYRYFKFDRSRTKMTMLSIGGVCAVMYVMYFIGTIAPLGEMMFLSSWSFGSVLLIAGGFAMITSPEYTEEAMTPGIMDTSKLSYGPPLEEPEPEGEAAPEPEVAPTVESEDTKPESEEPSVAPKEATE